MTVKEEKVRPYCRRIYTHTDSHKHYRVVNLSFDGLTLSYHCEEEKKKQKQGDPGDNPDRSFKAGEGGREIERGILCASASFCAFCACLKVGTLRSNWLRNLDILHITL